MRAFTLPGGICCMMGETGGWELAKIRQGRKLQGGWIQFAVKGKNTVCSTTAITVSTFFLS